MRGSWKRLAIATAAGAGGIVVLLLAFLAFLCLTGPGHRLVAWAARPLSGGTVEIEGLSGTLPDRIRASRLVLRDAKGEWLRAEGIALDWNALSYLFGDHVAIRDFRAAHVAIMRRPVSQESQGKTPAIDIAALGIARIDLAAQVLGHQAQLTVSGALHYVSRHDMRADITARRLDAPGSYRIEGGIEGGGIQGSAAISETGAGLIGGLAGLPDIGPVTLDATASRAAGQNRVELTLQAGRLQGYGEGAVDLDNRVAAINFALNAPAMTPRPGLAWDSIAVEGRMNGAFDRPDIEGALTVTGLAAGGVSIGRIRADLHGTLGGVDLAAIASDTEIAGLRNGLLATPISLSAHADLTSAAKPVTFALSHTLFSVRGEAALEPTLQGEMVLALPDLAAFANGAPTGSGSFRLAFANGKDGFHARLRGDATTTGDTLAARALGTAHLDASATLGQGALAADAVLTAAALKLHAVAATRDGAPEYRFDLALTDLARLEPGVTGDLALHGILKGPADAMTLMANGEGRIGTKDAALQNLTLSLDAEGLPHPQSGRFKLAGAFAGAPIALNGRLAGRGPKLRLALDRGEWKSVRLTGDLIAARDGAPETATLTLAAGRMADLAALAHADIDGALDAKFDMTFKSGAVRVAAGAKNLSAGAAKIGTLDLSGDIARAFTRPAAALTFKAGGIAAAAFTGDADGTLDGPEDALAIALKARMKDSSGEPVALSGAATLNTPKKQAVLQALEAQWRGKTLKLLAPATVSFANGIDLGTMRISPGDGEIAVSGSVSPRLQLALSAEAITPRDLEPFTTGLFTQGRLAAKASLTGTMDAPQGSFTVTGEGLLPAAGGGIPPAALHAKGTLAGGTLTLDATLTGGKSMALTLQGKAGLSHGGALNLTARGNFDLSLVGASLMAQGQNVTGILALDAKVGGTLAAPRVNGTASLAKGELHDYSAGIRLRDIDAKIEIRNSALTVASLSANAGGGSVTGSGKVDLLAPGMPADLHITAKHARPVIGDRFSATVDADITLKGKLTKRIEMAGNIRATESEIRVPDNFPPQVAVLKVRRAGQASSAPPARPARIALNLTLSAPGHIFLRGRGLDAELEGDMKITGTTRHPRILGSFDMRRGTLNLAGSTLNFQTGKVSFDGSSLGGQLDPTLDFVASTTQGTMTAELDVTGHASAPQVKLTSTPAMPQDEILAQLLFQQSVSQLTPFQLAEIAQAVATLSGVGAGFDPVDRVRRSLGLDRLAVGAGGGSQSSALDQTTVEAGKYVLRNVYVGATQTLSGGTGVNVQVDITKNLKATATANTSIAGGGTSNSAGLTYQFEY